eukprot:SAG22_NODE_6026_length_914_cov_0.849080_1_plen_276_part_10
MDHTGAFEVVAGLCDVVVELSPHSVLRNYVKGLSPSMSYMFLQRRNFDSAPLILQCLGQLFAIGVDVTWANLLEDDTWHTDPQHSVPTIVWEHKVALRSAVWKHDLKRHVQSSDTEFVHSVPQRKNDSPSVSLWDSHMFDGKPVLPGAKLLWDAADGDKEVRNVEWLKFAKTLGEYTVQRQTDTGFTSLVTQKGDKLMTCTVGSEITSAQASAQIQLDESYESVDPVLVYAALAKYTPLRLDPPFQTIRGYHVKDGTAAVADISVDWQVSHDDAGP